MSGHQIVGERFEIRDPERDLLGRGGVGDVYRATDVRSGEFVAIKALRPEVVASDPSIVARFLREGEALRQLNHPNIVEMVDAIEEDGRHYLVMEYVSAGSLRDLLEEGGALSVAHAVEVALDIADALTRAHRLGIIHRDLKPSNVMLTEEGTPRLTDFGLAHLTASARLTETGTVVGTVFYLSPEACRGEKLDRRTDIWSFGVMLYEMLTGEPPFTGETFPAVSISILTQPVPDLTQTQPDLPAALVDLVQCTLEKDPAQRISSMRLVGAELEAILEAVTREEAAKARREPSPGAREPLVAREGSEGARPAETEPPPPPRSAPALPKAERRIATVLLAEVSGSAELLDELGAEAWFKVMDDVLRILRSEVERLGGAVDQSQGARLIALFGATMAHEDDPERGVLAALAMQEAIERYAAGLADRERIELLLRVGVNTGEVIAASVGDGRQHSEETTMGRAIALAARMGMAAEPGTVMVAENTYRLVGPLFEWQSLGEIAVRGVSEPLAVYRPLAHRAAPGKRRGIAGLESPLVGRETELRALGEAVERLRSGVGGIVTVVGEAGIGKSRLVAEVRKATREDAVTAPLRWIEGRCLSYATGVAYQLWLDTLRGLLDVAPDAPPLVVREVLRKGVRSLCADRYDDVYPYLARMMSLPLEDEDEAKVRSLDAESLQFVTFRAVGTLLECAAGRRPLVITCEDLHWADPTSIELLERLLALTDRAPLLLICVFRPETEHGCWRIKETAARLYRHRHTDLWLSALSAAESETLVGNLLHVEDLAQELRSRILARAEGNPFYVEEILRSLIDDGTIVHDEEAGRWRATREVDDIAIPDTLHGVLVARIDRLREETRRVLRLASVIGRTFTHRVLAEIARHDSPLPGQGEGPGVRVCKLEAHLLTLQREQLIRERTRLPELEYIFKHELTRVAAYNGLLKGERRVYHRRVAEALERLFPDRVEEQVELLAYHYDQGEEWSAALGYLVRAGDKAAAAYANQDALGYYARALEVCEQVGDAALATAYDVAQKRGLIHLNLQDVRCIADYNRMLVAARRLGDRHRVGLALAHRGWAEWRCHDPEAAEKTLKTALEVAGEEFEDVRVSATVTLIRLYHSSDRHAEAEPLLPVAEALSPKVDGLSVLRAWDLADFLRPSQEGRFDDALALIARWRDAEAKSETLSLASRWFEALARAGKGEYERALELLEKGIATCERIGGYPRIRLRALNTIGWIYGEIRDYQRAMAWNRRGVEEARRTGFPDPEVEHNALINLGDNLMATGCLDEAEKCFLQVERVARDPKPHERHMLWRYSQRLFHSYGELWLIRGDPDRALAYADECLALAERTKSAKNVVKARRLRGQAFLAQGQLARAEQELLTALEVARQVGNPPQLWKTWAALGELRRAQGRAHDARRAYGHALSVIDRVAEGLREGTRREIFLSSQHVQEIRRAAALIR